MNQHLHHSRRLRRTLLAATAISLLALTGCAGSMGDSKSATSDDAGAASAPEPAANGVLADGLDYSAADGAAAEDAPARADNRTAPAQQAAIISTGSITLTADDVAEALFDAKGVAADHRGQLTDEQTETGNKGGVARSAIVIRVPASEFSQTMTDLGKVGKLVSSNTNSEDVTTQVIDTEVRVRAQEESLRRIETLLARAESIRDIMAIETQLSQRQAELDSLKQQQAWLRDQTSLSTITVHLKKTPKAAGHQKNDDSGFLAGLGSGWDGLKAFTNGAATLIGVLLPFAAVLLIVGLPLWALGRRWFGRRRTTVDPEPDTATV